jgi:hypothetical protein
VPVTAERIRNKNYSVSKALIGQVIPLVVNFSELRTPVKTKLLSVRLRLGIPPKNLRNKGYQLNQLRFYTYFINKLINL